MSWWTYSNQRDERENKRKLEDMRGGKSTRRRQSTHSKDQMKEWKVTRRKHMKKMDKLLQTINDSVGSHFHGMNTTIAKMKEESDDRFKQMRIWKRKCPTQMKM